MLRRAGRQISQGDGAALLAMANASLPAAVRVRVAAQSSMPDFNATNMAAFSSLGPAADGRLKPDIVAPGDRIYSASSDGLPYTYQAPGPARPLHLPDCQKCCF